MSAPAHPYNDPAVAVELTMRERTALMTPDDWAVNVDRLLALPIGTPSQWDVDEAVKKAPADPSPSEPT